MHGTVKDFGIEDVRPDGRTFRMTWDEVTQVTLDEIDRDDRLFLGDPAYWELSTVAGVHWMLYSREARKQKLLDHLARALPNFSKERAERALRRRDSDSQIVWQRAVVLCPSCAGALDDATSRQKERNPWDRFLECPRDGATVRVGRQRIPPQASGRIKR